jgi:hypothetical protein
MTYFPDDNEFGDDANAPFFHTTPTPEVFQEMPVEDVHYGRRARRNVEDDIADAIELVRNAKQIPMSGSIMLKADEINFYLEEIGHNLPVELLEARRALREREALMAEEVRKAENLIELTKARATQMVESTEIVRQAKITASEIIAAAQARARQMINETEDYLDQKLADVEISLSMIQKTVERGRSRLTIQDLPASLNSSASGFFDGTPAPASTEVFDFDNATDDDGFSSGF